ARKWRRLELEIHGDYFAGSAFGMVDAAYGPIFRYFDVMDPYLPLDVFEGCVLVQQWRRHLAARPSVQNAVAADYPEKLLRFLKQRNSHISGLIASEEMVA
ncbi:MAG TPA: glutathione S-transferase family protein, partial [Gammaproteobacteria bacterium]|nr:glutathione S-transferase family protein [Gammaproteobacteria bacterium]